MTDIVTGWTFRFSFPVVETVDGASDDKSVTFTRYSLPKSAGFVEKRKLFKMKNILHDKMKKNTLIPTAY